MWLFLPFLSLSPVFCLLLLKTNITGTGLDFLAMAYILDTSFLAVSWILGLCLWPGLSVEPEAPCAGVHTNHDPLVSPPRLLSPLCSG